MWNNLLFFTIFHFSAFAANGTCLTGFSEISQKIRLESAYQQAQKKWDENPLWSKLNKNLSRLQRDPFLEKEDIVVFQAAEADLKKLQVQYQLFSEVHEENPNLREFILGIEKITTPESQRASQKQIKELAAKMKSDLQKVDRSLPNLTSLDAFKAYAQKANARIIQLINNPSTTPAAVEKVRQDLLANILLLQAQSPPENPQLLAQAKDAYEELSKISDPFQKRIKNGEEEASQYKILLSDSTKEKLKKALNHF